MNSEMRNAIDCLGFVMKPISNGGLCHWNTTTGPKTGPGNLMKARDNDERSADLVGTQTKEISDGYRKIND